MRVYKSMTSALVVFGWAAILCLIVLPGGVDSLKSGEHSAYDSLCQDNHRRVALPWDCRGYVQCTLLGDQSLRAVWHQCAGGMTFNPDLQRCERDYRCVTYNASTVCASMRPGLVFPHPSDCHKFHDCSQPQPRAGLPAWEGRCPRHQVFSDVTHRCENQESNSHLQCNYRPVSQPRCDGRERCEVADCSHLPDGPHSFETAAFTEHFFVCTNNNVSLETTCDVSTEFFDPTTQTCAGHLPEDSMEMFCTYFPGALLPDPTSCSKYYNCSQRDAHPELKRYQEECPFPRLFSTVTLTCAMFDDVSCGRRREAINQCDYQLINSPDCGPSCDGLPDGPHPHPARPLTADNVICRGGRAVGRARCAAGSVFDPHLRLCSTDISQRALTDFCRENRQGRVAHPSRCAQYYSCDTVNTTQDHHQHLSAPSECRYPLLVDAKTVTCQPHHSVDCGARVEPISPCDYVRNQCKDPGCPKCEQNLPSCLGKPDNMYPMINLEMTSHYIKCRDQRVFGSGRCPFGNLFDMRALNCTADLSRLSLFDYCVNNPTGRVQNPAHCGQYYDCRLKFEEIAECPASQLYDIDSRTCLRHDLVDCYGRPSQYDQTATELKTVGHKQRNITDIQTDISHHQKAIVTIQKNISGRQKNITNIQQSITTRQNNITKIQKSITNIQKGITDRQDKITNRQANITGIHKTISNIQKTIASRHDIIKSIQKIIANRQSNITQMYSNITALQNHITDLLMNATDQEHKTNSSNKRVVFSPSAIINVLKVLAVKTGSKNIARMCEGGYHHIVFKQDNCAQYINCSNIHSPLGRYIEECDVGFLFDRQSRTCLPYDQVKCQGRYEPKQACEYKRVCHQISPNGSCDKCHLHFKSCDTRVGSSSHLWRHPAHLYQGFQNNHVFCVNNRAAWIASCPAGKFFNHLSGVCSSELTEKDILSVCTAYPNVTLSHPLDCAKYIQCSAGIPTSSPGSEVQRYKMGECPYALLFFGEACHDFDKVTCGLRKEPVTPCEYVELSKCPAKLACDENNNCKLAKCEPCEQRYPSCKNLADGRHPFPGRVLTGHFITCYRGRTMGIHKCVKSLFDPVSRNCGLALRVVLAAAVRVPAILCSKYPSVLLPHPTQCSQFLNCSSEARQHAGAGSHQLSDPHSHANNSEHSKVNAGLSSVVGQWERCPSSQWFNQHSRRCENYMDVYKAKGCQQTNVR